MFFHPRHPSPLLSERILLISMSRNLASGGNFVQSGSELPREQGGVPWQSCNLTLNNNGSPGRSGTCWQLGRLTWSSTPWTVGCGKWGRIPLEINQISGIDLVLVVKLAFIMYLYHNLFVFPLKHDFFISFFNLKYMMLKLKSFETNI